MTDTTEVRRIIPQKGFQMNFLSNPADIIIGGGKAGSGKSFSLLLEPLRHINTVPGFGAVIFRRTSPMISNEGGLRDTADKLYPHQGLIPSRTNLRRVSPITKNKIKFSHLENESDKLNRQGSQIPFLGFDELTHFTQTQFWYLVGRSRSTCGVRPYIRATCNPDPDSRVKNLIEWWIDPETGYIIKERDGVLRYFFRLNDKMVRGTSVADVVSKAPEIFASEAYKNTDPKDLILSLTFIEGDIMDNKELLNEDPGYLAKLMSQDEQTRSQLLDGNRNMQIDDNSLGNYAAISDIFTNFLEPNPKPVKCITTDVARFGRDLTVSGVRFDWSLQRIDIKTKSKTTETYAMIEEQRREYGVGKSQVLVDQDGVGGGVVDEGGYLGFSGGLPALPDPDALKKDSKAKPENYKYLKTQCYYRMFDKVNNRLMRITSDNIRVDGVRTTKIVLNGKTYDVRDLIMKDLKSIKRANPDNEGKFEINKKEAQKIILDGRSPDFGDMIMQRTYFDLVEKPELNIYFG